jgi:hypothetical protein
MVLERRTALQTSSRRLPASFSPFRRTLSLSPLKAAAKAHQF